MTRASTRYLGLAWMPFAVLTACSGDPAHLLASKPTGADDPAQSASAEAERLRKLQMVRVVNYLDQPSGVAQEKGWLEVSSDIVNLLCEKTELQCVSRDFCYACRVEQFVCATQKLLEIVSLRSQPFPVITDGLNYEIPPQSTATNAILAKQAMTFAQTAVSIATNSLRTSMGLSDGLCSSQAVPWRGNTADGTPLRIGPLLSHDLVDAVHLMREAAEKAADFTLALADAQMAEPSLTNRIEYSRAAAELSRAAAAHLLVGGDPGIMGFVPGSLQATKYEFRPREALCTVGRLSPSGQAALAVLRQSGIAPVAVSAFPKAWAAAVNAIDTHALLTGTGSPDGTGAVPFGSVKQRLSDLWGIDFDHPRADAPPGGVAEYFKLTEADFTEARTYLDQEYVAFSRATSVSVPGPARADGTAATFPVFPATANAPPQWPASYYAAVARYVGPDTVETELGAPEMGLARLLDYAYSKTAELLDLEGGVTDPKLRQDMTTPLVSLLLGRERRARVTLVRAGGPNDEVTASILWATDPAEGTPMRPLGMVVGEDALRCALYGTNEGAPCTEAELPAEPMLGTPPTPQPGFDVQSVEFSLPANHQSRAYLVRRKPLAFLAHGSYEVLMGMALPPAVGQQVVASYVPDLEARAGKNLGAEP